MCLWVSYKKKNIKIFFGSLKSLEKGVASELDPGPHQNVMAPQHCFIPPFIIWVVKSFNLRSKKMKLTWRQREEPAWIWWWRDSPATRRKRGGYPVVQNRANQSTKQRKPFQVNKDQLNGLQCCRYEKLPYDADPDTSFHFDTYESRSDFSLLMRIRILLLTKVMKICDHLSTDPSRLHFEPPLWASKALLNSILSLHSDSETDPDTFFNIDADLPVSTKIRIHADPDPQHWYE